MSARKHRTPLLLLTAFLGAAGIAACTLNPQPLPPEDDDRLKANDPEEAPGTGGTTSQDGAASVPPARPADASAPSADSAVQTPDSGSPDATIDAGDAGTTSDGDAAAD